MNDELSLRQNSISKLKLQFDKDLRDDVIKDNIDDYLDPNPYLGYRFENKIKEMKENNTINKAEETTLRDRCWISMLVLVKQIKQRLPDNMKIYQVSQRIMFYNHKRM